MLAPQSRPSKDGAAGDAPLLPSLPERSALRKAIGAATRTPEPVLMPGLVEQARLQPEQAEAADRLAMRLARHLRERSRHGGKSGSKEGLVQGLMQEFSLSSQEGVALMCLAEALLRIPDDATRDALIRDKIAGGNWERHLGRSPSMFVNAAAWGLLITGKLVATHSEGGLSATLRRALARGGEPLIRKGVDLAMRMMGEQFVTGQTIEQALENSRPRQAQGFRHSYDMLGEAAMAEEDAQAYCAAYAQAIEAIGAASAGRGLIHGPGISIKLSALHPRYARAQRERVMAELYPRLAHLALRARHHDIGLNIDAEESERLELSLDLLERLCHEPGLAGWNGIGFVIQAYQKRCPPVIDFIVDLARRSGHRLMVRLVKGAYWDSEIKRAQLDGQEGYPVYTRKAYTDVAYLACARKLLAAPDAVFPQFATHNARTVAAVVAMAGPDHSAEDYEFQCLHGMGEPLYEQMVGQGHAGVPARACRIYAPVGTHETLLAYLVRRLLENGANTSFVNRLADESMPLEALVRDPLEQVAAWAADDGLVGAPHPGIALPRALLGPSRVNSRGLDLPDEDTLARLALHLAEDRRWEARPLVAGMAGTGMDAGMGAEMATAPLAWELVRNPADAGDVVGRVRSATTDDVQHALAAATEAAPRWADTPPAERAARLEAAAQHLEDETFPLIPLLVREAGKTCANAVSEVREAVDFLRYYAAQVRRDFDNGTHRPLGPVVCISPWNFPLAIFIGQVAAALAAGNVVLAKPAEQTPLVAAEAVRALHAAGIPDDALQLLPGPGDTVGAALVADARVQGVMFTGSTEVACILQQVLAQRLTAQGQVVPLVAETGGQNAMVVDSSALVEQAVADIVASAFDSAGQRCSALRLLCVQEDVADRLLAMLRGAMAQLAMGDPRALATDVGPVIDAAALEVIEQHVAAMVRAGHAMWRAPAAAVGVGHFAAPTLIEIDSVAALGREVFGPVLHVLRYPRERLSETLEAINATGYGLTQGVHTRLDETIAQVAGVTRAGNLYVNRNVVGAVVGVQPFGGEGLSGTGPKAGGPLVLLRLLAERPAGAARDAVASCAARGAERGSERGAAPGSSGSTRPTGPTGSTAPSASSTSPGPQSAVPAGLSEAAVGRAPSFGAAWASLRGWLLDQGLSPLAAALDRLAAQVPDNRWQVLCGPTGELNLYRVLPRESVLCLADDEQDQLLQLGAALALGCRPLWPLQPLGSLQPQQPAPHQAAPALLDRLPADVRRCIEPVADWRDPSIVIGAVLQHGSSDALRTTAAALAERPGPIVGLTGLRPGDSRLPLEPLLMERSLSLNTAAAGGNASLMTIG